MSAMMQAPPPSAPPQGPPPGPPPAGAGGHGAFSEEQIQEMMADTGASYEQVCVAIDQTGATSKEQVFANFYSGQGIEPQGAPAAAMPPETVAPGAVQGQPPAALGPEGMAPVEAPMAGAALAEPEGISPEVAQAMHDRMSPAAKYKRTRR